MHILLTGIGKHCRKTVLENVVVQNIKMHAHWCSIGVGYRMHGGPEFRRIKIEFYSNTLTAVLNLSTVKAYTLYAGSYPNQSPKIFRKTQI